MASPSIPELEARIRADRAALRASRHVLRRAVEQRLSSAGGLFGGFAAGVAGGWILKGPTKNKQIRRLERQLARERARRGTGAADTGGGSGLFAVLPMLSMGLRLAAMLRGGAAPPGPDDTAAGGGP